MTDAPSKIPTVQLIEELASRDEVEVESKHFCRSEKYTVTLRVDLAEKDCPSCLR